MRNLIVAVLAITLIACNNNPPVNDVQGKWKLVKVENAFAQHSTDFSLENIIFDFGNSTVNISGNNSGNFYMDNGDYPYTLQMDNSLSNTFQSMTLTLKGTQYLYKKTGNEMTLDNGYVDGDKLSFIKQ